MRALAEELQVGLVYQQHLLRNSALRSRERGQLDGSSPPAPAPPCRGYVRECRKTAPGSHSPPHTVPKNPPRPRRIPRKTRPRMSNCSPLNDGKPMVYPRFLRIRAANTACSGIMVSASWAMWASASVRWAETTIARTAASCLLQPPGVGKQGEGAILVGIS